MNNIKSLFALLLITFLIFSCATKGLQIRAISSNSSPSKNIDHAIYLLGDVGEKQIDSSLLTGLDLLKKHEIKSGLNSSHLLFLGDNSYDVSLFRELDFFNGVLILIPGDKDWLNGLDGLNKNAERIKSYSNVMASFYPQNGCPLVSVSLSNKVQLIILDTQWYLEDWNNHPDINDDCKIKTRNRFFEVLEEEVRAAENKTTLIAMHHPIYTNGIRGGYYAFNDHIFPFEIALPLPGIGSILTQFRSQGGISVQDRFNEKYNALMKRIKTIAFNNYNLLFLSGHEHNLQYIESGNIKQIVSGTGSVSSASSLGLNGIFSYGNIGFAELLIYEDGTSWVNFYGEKQNKPHLIFGNKVLHNTDTSYDELIKNDFSEHITRPLYDKKTIGKPEIYKKLWGDFYRDEYSKDIRLPIINLDSLFGGVKVLRKGDSSLYRSVIVESESGDYYVIKAAKKESVQYLQHLFFKDSYVEDDLKQTVIETLINDLHTASFPFSNAVVNGLLKTVNVNFQSSEYVYLPKQKALGSYNAFLGDEVCIIEPLPFYNKTKQSTSNTNKIISSDDLFELLRGGVNRSIDEKMYINARLIDLLVGDWSRDKNNWYWKQVYKANKIVYEPIPINREQAFSKFDGVIFDIARGIAEPMNQFQDFNNEIDKKSIKWLTHSAIQLDRLLVQVNSNKLWLEQVEFIKNQLTDEVIGSIFNQINSNYDSVYLDAIKKRLIQRRDQLEQIIRLYLSMLDKLIILQGSDNEDIIQISRLDNGLTKIQIYEKQREKEPLLVLDRNFDSQATKEIWIYMLDGNDQLNISGRGNSKIKIRVVGGLGIDQFDILNGRNCIIYDNKKNKRSVSSKKHASLKFTDNYELNVFDYNKNISSSNAILPSFGYNPDDGFMLGVSNTYTMRGFERAPFTQRHQLKAGYYFATEGFDIAYNGDFANFISDWNLGINGFLTSESYSYNYFGLGNESENFDNQKGFNYNRVRMAFQSLSMGVYKKGYLGNTYGFKFGIEGVNVRDTPGRFITEFPPRDDISTFSQKYFATIGAIYNYQSFDDYIVPTRGIYFDVNFSGIGNVEMIKNSFLSLDAKLSFYNALIRNRRLVLKTTLNSSFRTGDSFMFYQAAHLGGKSGLRGYRAQRFSGSKAMVSNLDFRYSFNNFKTKLIPLKFGIFAGYDFGRVWYNDEKSKVWHDSYGGGFWVSSLDIMSANFNLFGSSEGLRFSFGFNFKM